MADYTVKIQAELQNFEKVESQLRSLENNPINIKVQLTGLDGSDLSGITKQIQSTASKASNAFNKNFHIDLSKSGLEDFAKQQANLVNETKKTAKQIQPIIAKALGDATQNEVARVTKNTAKSYINNEVKVAQQSVNAQIKQLQQQAKQVQKIEDILNSNTLDARLSSFNSTLNKFSSNTAEYERAAQSLQSLENAYQEVKVAKDAFDNDSSDVNAQNLIQSYERVQNILKQTQSEMRILSNEQSKLISSSTKASMIKSFESYFDQNSKAAKKYADQVEELRQELDNLSTSADKVNFDTKFNNLKSVINRNGDTGKSAWDELKRGFGQIAEFTGIYGVTSQIQDALLSMPGVVVEVDDAMTNLQMATGATDEQAQQLMSTYSEMGKVLKATATDISASATEWMKQGQSIADSQTLAEYSIILSKIGDLSSTDATKTITAAMKSYNLNIDEVMGFIDQISSIDIASATDVGGLSQAFNEVAANARQAGVETQQLLAYAAAIGETTQEGMASVGTSLNSIFSRMGNIKLARLKDYENNGEDLSNVETVLRGVGISLRDSINEFRDFDEVLAETASRWKTFSGVQQRAVAQAFAGKLFYCSNIQQCMNCA